MHAYEQRAGGGAGCAARLFLLFSFPCSADHERDWPPCKVVFFGLATNSLNVRNNKNNNNNITVGFSPILWLKGLTNVFYFSENSEWFRDLRVYFLRFRKIKGRRKSRTNSNSENYEIPRNIGQRKTSDRPGHRGVKCVAPKAVQYRARDLVNDDQYHGRQQEAPRIVRTRLLLGEGEPTTR